MYIYIFIENKKQHKASNCDIKFHIKQNSISDIALNIVRYVSEKGQGEISEIDKNLESGFCFVKWTSDSYTLQSSNKLGKYVIKAGDLVFNAVYLNPLANFKSWYSNYEKTIKGK